MTIEEVYNKYKHFDKLLSDPIWLQGNHKVPDHVLYDLWQAVKENEQSKEEEEATNASNNYSR